MKRKKSSSSMEDLISDRTKRSIDLDGPVASVILYEGKDGTVFTGITGSRFTAIGLMKTFIRYIEFEAVMGFQASKKEQQEKEAKTTEDIKETK